MERFQGAPARLYQRYRTFFDRLIPALGLVLMFVLVERITGVFPLEWRVFIAGGVLVGSLVAPIAGYVVFVLALAYPLYSISIYVAALALAALALLAFAAARNLAAVVLMVCVPLLVPYRATVAVPLLAGLWWAEWGGVLVGLGSALWLKLFVGACGAAPDLIRLGDQPLAVGGFITRFHTANSLQTLLWLADPLAPTSQALLLHILEILGWGLAGYVTGLVGRRMEGMPRPSVGLLASVSAGLLGLWGGSVLLPLILDLRTAEVRFTFLLSGFLIECVWGGIIAVGVYGLSRYFTRPTVRPIPSRSEPSLSPPPSSSGAEGAERASSLKSMSQSWSQPRTREDDPTDIIMIDLD